ncbi:MAG: response regulator [Desulfobulbus sp.]
MADILVIDDEESVRYSFHRFLTMENHSVVTAACYCSALLLMDTKCFDLILADIHLPDGCGVDIIGEITRRNIKTGVIIMTAYPCNEAIRMSFSMDAIDYLVKPLRQKKLVYSVNNALMHISHAQSPS